MDILDAIRELTEGLAKAHAEIARLHWIHDNTVIHGKVVDVDPKKQLARILIGENGDGKEVKSAWIPYSQTAGTRKVHSAPSINQQMTLVAPNGDLAQAFALPYTWANKNPSPSEKGDEDVDLRGKTKRTQKDGSVKQEVDGVTREYSKQSHSVTIHKDPENQQEGQGETVDDEHPWKGNRAKALHKKALSKDGGFELTINDGDNQKKHKIVVNPTDDGVEISTHNGKHKITIKKNDLKVSFGDGQHETTYSDQGIKHKSSQRVTIDSPQIEHLGDMMLKGGLTVSKVVQSAGFIGNLQGVAGGIGFLGGLTPPTSW